MLSPKYLTSSLSRNPIRKNVFEGGGVGCSLSLDASLNRLELSTEDDENIKHLKSNTKESLEEITGDSE